jgi:hypothetical protein
VTHLSEAARIHTPDPDADELLPDAVDAVVLATLERIEDYHLAGRVKAVYCNSTSNLWVQDPAPLPTHSNRRVIKRGRTA